MTELHLFKNTHSTKTQIALNFIQKTSERLYTQFCDMNKINTYWPESHF